MRTILRAAFIAGALLIAARDAAASPGSFVYVATMPPCNPPLPCNINLLVYDAATSGLVTTIPLAIGKAPAVPGLAISPDGSRLYVSVSVGSSPAVLIVDATRHQFLGVVSGAFAGRLAVSHDGRILFDGLGSGLSLIDTTSQQLVKSIPGGGTLFTPDPVQDRVYWIGGGSGCGDFSTFHAYDTALGADIPVNPFAQLPFAGLAWTHLFVSRDDSRFYLTSFGQLCNVGSGDVRFLDPVGLTQLKDVGLPLLAPNVPLSAPIGTIDAPTRRRVYVWNEFGTLGVFDRDTFAAISQLTISGLESAVITSDESRAYVVSPDTLRVMNLGTNAVDRTLSVPGITANIVTTPPNPALNVCSYRVDTKQSSWTVDGGSTSIGLKTSCTWLATSDSSWARVVMPSGTGDATLSLTVDPNTTSGNRTATLSIGGQIVTVTQASVASSAPFGTIDTPADNATGVNGAIAVTGWALDDVGVTRVRVMRDPVLGESSGQVFIGNATFIDGARPDVQNAYPAFPYASRAGWGLQVLTNMLPNHGNGQFRLYAYADDLDGHTALLGFRTITVDNAGAALPFGTIDTPGQGDTVSGTIINFGWALSSALIATDGSTIDVVIDGVAVGHPVYGNFRSDVATGFPNLPNSNGAIGYFILDTTQLANGVHTVAWVVRDTAGQTQGIGSRFFTVAN